MHTKEKFSLKLKLLNKTNIMQLVIFIFVTTVIMK